MYKKFLKLKKGLVKKARHLFNAAVIKGRNLTGRDSGYRYIFHHLPKCGGTTAFDALSEWFICIKDYPPAWSNLDNPRSYKQFCDSPEKIDRLRDYHILCGHYHLKGSFLHERYPGLLENSKCRLITFLRHPLEIQLSLFYYELRNGRFDTDELLEDRLLLRQNYLASIIPCDESNFREVLDKYFFIGVVEEYQKSFDHLATLLGKPQVRL